MYFSLQKEIFDLKKYILTTYFQIIETIPVDYCIILWTKGSFLKIKYC